MKIFQVLFGEKIVGDFGNMGKAIDGCTKEGSSHEIFDSDEAEFGLLRWFGLIVFNIGLSSICTFVAMLKLIFPFAILGAVEHVFTTTTDG